MANYSEKFAQVGQSLGYEAPAPKEPKIILPVRVDGNIAYISGNVAFSGTELLFKGRIGADVSVEDGQRSAAFSVLNCLLALDRSVGLDKVDKVLKVTGFLSCTESFTDQPTVMNGGSQVLLDVFGEAGQHARSALGIHTLPLGASTEVEMIVALKA
ncbi:MAG: LysR family transcriptional regulator [Paenibacillus sp.]|nr:LysR family transcriptional regulator [Paenibacillus sp.]